MLPVNTSKTMNQINLDNLWRKRLKEMWYYSGTVVTFSESTKSKEDNINGNVKG